MSDFLAKYRIHIGLTLVAVIIIASGLLIYANKKGSIFSFSGNRLTEVNSLKQENLQLKNTINDLENRCSGEVNSDETGSVKSAETKESAVNINNADVQTLDSLPGIGAVKAQAIIDWRTQNGGFQKIEDIMNVSGIGQSTFNKIKDLISIK